MRYFIECSFFFSESYIAYGLDITSTDSENIQNAIESNTDPDTDPIQPQAVEDNTYTIGSALDSTKVFDAKGGSTNNGTQIQSYNFNQTDAQVWKIVTSEDGYSTIYHAVSGKVLDVSHGKAYSGAKIQLYDANGTMAQKWIITSDGSYYKITSALNNAYVLDLHGASTANGAIIQLWTDNGSLAQRWSLSFAETVRKKADRLARENYDVLDNGTYSIDSLLGTNKVIDIPGGTATNGANLQTYNSNQTSAQTWTISHDSNGYITITNTDSGLVLDVPQANASNCVSVQLWQSNGTLAQKWIAVATQNGFKLLSAVNSRYAIDVAYGNTDNGALIWLYEDNGSNAQCWNVTEQKSPIMKLDSLAKDNRNGINDGVYAIRSELLVQLVLDACSAGTTDGTDIQTYGANGTEAQMWQVTHDSKGYITLINVNSGKALDVQSGNTSSGTKVQLYTPNGTRAQKWIAVQYGKKFTLVSALSSSLVLDVKGGNATYSTPIQIWDSNNTAAQSWYFTQIGSDGVNVSIDCNDNSILPYDLGFGDYALMLPSYATSENTFLQFDKDVVIGTDGAVIEGGTEFAVGDYIKDTLDDIVSFVVYDTSGSVLSNMYVLKSANLSAIYVNSEDPTNYGRTWVESSADHTNSAKGTISVISSDGTSIYDGKLNQIKGRGNTSWTFLNKKPYQIKLDKKTDLLQTGDKSNKAKTWALISDEYDWSSSRNLMAYSYAKLLGVSSAIDFDMVDFYYDGEYRGTYLLCEKVQVGSGRVDITDLEEEIEELNPDIDNTKKVIGTNSYGMKISYGKNIVNPDDISGGYLIENDSLYYRENSYFCVWDGTTYQYFVCKSPDIWSYKQADYMSCLIQDLFDAFNNNGVVPTTRNSSRAGMTTEELIDLDSFAKLYWANELLKNTDGLKFSSTFLYKDVDTQDGTSLIYFGPAWDFDLSCGSGEAGSNTNEWFTRKIGLSSSYMKDPYVVEAIEDSKSESIGILREFLNGGALIDKMESCKSSLKMNKLAWQLKRTANIDVTNVYNSLNSDIDAYKEVASWVNERINWIEAQ